MNHKIKCSKDTRSDLTINRLLSAEFKRLWRNKIFHICLVAILFLSVLLIISDHATFSNRPSFLKTFSSYYFEFNLITSGLGSFFIALFVGTDYSDGIIRNKILAGHSRLSIYFSDLIVCTTAFLIMNVIALITTLSLGLPLFGFSELNFSELMVSLCFSVLITTAYVSILLFFCRQIQSKSLSVVLTLLLFITLMIISYYSYFRISAPELTETGVSIQTETTTGEAVSTPYYENNPYYVTGITRTIFTAIANFLPAGQTILFLMGQAVHKLIMLLCSVFIIISTTFTGCISFKKKDLL